MKRLLCIVSAMNTGGAETFLMKIYRNIDRTKYQMDFCVNSDENFYSDEISKMGGRIYKVPVKSKNLFKSMNSIRKIVKENKYNYVIRVNQHSLSVLDLIAAKLGGAENLIMRSSNADSGGGISEILHRVFNFLPRIIPTVKLAPSIKAAEYTFGKDCVKNGKAYIIHNALDINEYSFSGENRTKKRNELGVENKFVIGHIGRFSKQKNHDFLIKVFKEISKIRDDAELLLIGEGELREEICEKAKQIGVKDKIKFLGVRADVPELLNAMDVFLFPSFFEGMPNTVIEAQTNGLPCLVSSSITEEVKITDIVKTCSLDRNATDWAKMLIAMYDECKAENREVYSDIMRENGYCINITANNFIKKILIGIGK